MKVLLVTDAFPPSAGGSGQSTAALAGALVKHGHEVSVVAARPWEPPRVDTTGGEGMCLVEVGVGRSRWGSVRRPQALGSFLERWSPGRGFDLAHAQHWLSADAAAGAAKRLGLPLVVTVRDYWPVCIWSTMLSGDERCPGCRYDRRILCVGRRHPLLWPVTPLLPPVVGRTIAHRQAVLTAADAVVAVSRHVAAKLPVASDVVPNLLDLSAMEDVLRQGLPESLPERYVLFIGKLELNKAADRVLPVVHRSGVRLPLVVAGAGPLEDDMRRQAHRFGIDVRWLGWVEGDLALRLMRHARATLFPSRWEEPLSRVLLEGLGVGAVMVVEPTGGSEEIVVHGQSGLVANSTEEMAASVRRIVDDGSLSERLRQGALQRARTVFSDEAVIGKLEALYRRVATQADRRT